MKAALVILGHSRAGKDSSRKILIQHLPKSTFCYKFSAPMKRTLEYLYCLPQGSLELDEVRNQLSQDGCRTYLDIMVDSFTHFRNLDPAIMLHRANIELSQSEAPLTLFTDCRVPMEVDLILDTFDKIYTLMVSSSVYARPKRSDEFLIDNYERLKHQSEYTFHVKNNGTKQDLELALLPVLSTLTKDLQQYA